MVIKKLPAVLMTVVSKHQIPLTIVTLAHEFGSSSLVLVPLW